MNKIIKSAVAVLALPLFKLYKQAAVRVLRGEALAFGERTLRIGRHALLAVISLALCLGLLLFGALLVHFSVFILVSVVYGDIKAAIIIFLLLGATYMIVATVILAHVCSEKTWRKRARLEQHVNKLTGSV